jgi:SAM-dependent methyltransferase
MNGKDVYPSHQMHSGSGQTSSQLLDPIQHVTVRPARPMIRHSNYAGRELESMHFAMKYRQWILDVFRPFLGKQIVEVGAGAGSFSELLLGTRPEWLFAVEPSTNMYPLLAKRLRDIHPGHRGSAYQGTLIDSIESIRQTGAPDSVIYVNVLEHIEDDVQELRTIHSLLQPGGHALIFAPAHPWLMGSIDHQFGHFRRYTRSELAKKCRDAGFTVRLSSYFDMLGIAPWWLRYCVLRSNTMDPFLVRLYDRYAVSLSRFLESVVSPPMGKNVILVAEKGK